MVQGQMYHGGTHDFDHVEECPGTSSSFFVVFHPSSAVLAGLEYDFSSDGIFETEL